MFWYVQRTVLTRAGGIVGSARDEHAADAVDSVHLGRTDEASVRGGQEQPARLDATAESDIFDARASTEQLRAGRARGSSDAGVGGGGAHLDGGAAVRSPDERAPPDAAARVARADAGHADAGRTDADVGRTVVSSQELAASGDAGLPSTAHALADGAAQDGGGASQDTVRSTPAERMRRRLVPDVAVPLQRREALAGSATEEPVVSSQAPALQHSQQPVESAHRVVPGLGPDADPDVGTAASGGAQAAMARTVPAAWGVTRQAAQGPAALLLRPSTEATGSPVDALRAA